MIDIKAYNFSTDIAPSVKSLIEIGLRGLADELSQYAEVAADNPLYYAERSFLGFLSNVFVRNDLQKRYAILQEYVNPKGRADMYIYDSVTGTHFIFESKWYPTPGNRTILELSEIDATKFMNNQLNQAEKYFKAEKYFFNKDTYLIAISFESIYQINSNKKAQTTIEKWTSNIHFPIKLGMHFYTYYSADTSGELSEGLRESFINYPGLAVYGRTKKVV